MITNDSTSDDKGIGMKVRTLGGFVLVAVLFYEMGLSRGRAEKSAGEYAALKIQHAVLKTEYERDYAQYSAMKNQYDQTLAQYSALKDQYDRIEARKPKPAVSVH